MKKLFLILLSFIALTSYGQAEFEKIALPANAASITAIKVNVQETNGEINFVTGNNIPIPYIPLNYSVLTPTTGGHYAGIDAKLEALSGTTAGISTRVWFTADQTTISAGTFDLTNPLSKGTAASHQQTVANNDDEKKYFTTDLIGQPFATATMFPAGTYAGNLTASTTPTNANQKFTVELYKCNNAGTPIASGVSGAPVGVLGVTVIMIMDSGEVTLANASVTNVSVSTVLGTGGFNIAAGERIRYHVSAEKVGTAGGVINESVYYGSSYNSFLDVPVIYNSTSIKDVSTVTNGVGTVTDALNNLYNAIPVNYSKIVYVNATNPNSATIFDLNNPPTVNDNLLKSDVANLYVGTDASGWVYNVSTLNYVTKSTPSVSSIFYNEGTTIPASNTTAPIERSNRITIKNGTGSNANNLFSINNIAGTETFAVNGNGGFGGSLLTISQNPISSTGNRIRQVMATSDIWSIYGADSGVDKGILVFEVGDDGSPIGSLGQSFEFRYNASGGGVAKTPLTIDYNSITALANMSVFGNVTANAIDTNTTKITITTSTSISTASTDANGIRQDGRHVVIDNGVNVINLTCNGGVTASYGKVGTGAITFVQGSGRTLVQLSGTAVFNGIAGSTATLWSNGTTDYLSINNY